MQEEREPNLEAGNALYAPKLSASMRSIQVAENVEIELKNPSSVWKGKSTTLTSF